MIPFRARLAALVAAATAGLEVLGTSCGRPYRGNRKRPPEPRNTPEIEAWNLEVERKKREKLAAKLARRAERNRR